MTAVTLARPWLTFDLGRRMQVLSWAINKPGFTEVDRIVWREVRNADLAKDMDVGDWLSGELDRQGASDAVCLLTSRNVDAFEQAHASVGAISAHCVATVGLSNAERVGHRVDRSQRDWGTINVALALSCGLSQTALIEASSIATQARTAAVMELGINLSCGGIATGTGTDCIAVAAPKGAMDYAGLHTDIGEAIGAAVYRAVLAGARQWALDNAQANRP